MFVIKRVLKIATRLFLEPLLYGVLDLNVTANRSGCLFVPVFVDLETCQPGHVMLCISLGFMSSLGTDGTKWLMSSRYHLNGRKYKDLNHDA